MVSVDKRWEELCAKVSDRLQTLENVQEEIYRYQVVLRVTEKTLTEIEQVVSFEYELVLHPKKAKQDLAEVKVSGFWGSGFRGDQLKRICIFNPSHSGN